MSHSESSARARSKSLGRRAVATVAALLVAITGVMGAGGAASAAVPGGPATVTTTVQFVSGLDLVTPIDELSATGDSDYFVLNIGYSCGSASACNSVTIKIDPQPVDPYYGNKPFATYTSSTLPSGASISGSLAAGYTVNLGNLPAGATGAFPVRYAFLDRGVGVSNQSFFPDDQAITNRVTIDAANAGVTSSASDSVTWHITTPSPGVRVLGGSTARADTDYTYSSYMTVDCLWERSTANHGDPATLCAESYEVTQTLPAGAQFVSVSPDGDYDAGTHTITWSASGIDAATGWSSLNSFGQIRTVTVRFPAAMFTGAPGCVIDVSTSLSVNATYLDGAQKSADTTFEHTANNCPAFTAVEPLTKNPSTQGSPNIVWENNDNYWNLNVYNRANIPGVAIVREDDLDFEHARVYAISTSPVGGTIEYTLDNGDTGTAISSYTAPTDRRIVSVVVTSPVLAGPNIQASDQRLSTLFRVVVRYKPDNNAPDSGWTQTNTANAVMTYPDSGMADVDAGTASSTVVITPRPMNFNSGTTYAAPVGGDPVAGTPVDFAMRGATSAIDAGVTIEPQYVFLAPYQWDIIDDSWTIDAGAPAGAVFSRYTVTVNGQLRQALKAEWPAGTTWGENITWPYLRVQATPSAAAPAGSTATANGLVSDSRNILGAYNSTYGGNNSQRFVDVADVDNDDSTTEYFANTSTSLRVGAASGLGTLKEICSPTPSGCDWISDTSAAVPVSPIADDITYRITLTNRGNTALANVVAYDVLPWVGDTGVSGGSASTPRGSDFPESVSAVSDVSTGLDLTFSESTNPCREEVYTGGPASCTDDWSGAAAGAQAIRAAVTGTLAANASVSFTYTAQVLDAPASRDQACNSIATAATGVPVSEPAAVCVVIASTDVEASGPDEIPAQLGRPVVFPFSFADLGTDPTAATVEVDVAEGITITDLAPEGWTCTAATAAPVEGPATLECTPDDELAPDEPVALDLAGIVTARGGSVTATVTSAVYDVNDANDEHTIVPLPVLAAASQLQVDKSDGTPAVLPGQETTYEITITNPLALEVLADVSVTDTLPSGTEFVSATDGGAFAAGSVTWTIDEIAANGSATVSVTVRVLDTAPNQITNGVDVEADDPAFPGESFSGSASDTDTVDRIELAKTVSIDDPVDPRPGDLVTFSFVVTNTGGGSLSGIAIADPLPGLSTVLFGTWPSAPGVLGAGDSVTAIATYPLQEADILAGSVENTATATGASLGGGVPSAQDSASLLTPTTTGLTLVKTGTLNDQNGDGIANPGETITFSFVASNTGNITVTGAQIDDPMVTGLAILADIGPGQSVTVSADRYAVTTADAGRGEVINVATVSGRTVAGTVVTSDPADARVAAGAAPLLLGMTGVQVGGVAGAAALLLLLGGASLLVARRRKVL